MSSAFANERMIRSYLKGLEDKLVRKMKAKTSKLSQELIIEALIEILPQRTCSACSNHQEPKELMRILSENQAKIVDQQEQIKFMKRKMEIEDELTHSFFKTLMKERTKETIENAKGNRKEKENNPFSLLVSRCEDPEKSQITLPLGSPICEITRSRRSETESSASRFGVCITSRSKMVSSRYQSSQFAMELESDERDKAKALAKLRKLQKFVFEKENCGRRASRVQKIWDFGISPTKRRVKEENQNLKAIQSNLVNHISILQKFREVPSIESLACREEVLKKREKLLKEKEEQFQKREMDMNKKHSQFLKRQKSHKIL